MASIISGFEYDIFISYRQIKDKVKKRTDERMFNLLKT